MQPPNDANQRADNLIALTRKLTDLLATETALLKEKRPSEITSINEEKSKLTAMYQRELADLKGDPRKIQALTKDRRDSLKSITADFRKATNRHMHTLQNYRTISEGIVKSVADEVAAKDVPAAGYGQKAMAPKPSASNTRAFAVNQVI